jgi:DNA (cytosine-5)-methyltransferase 1
MKFIELFAGVGGFRHGLESERWLQNERDGDLSKSPCREGFQCVYANEWDKYASAVYRYHWNDGTMHEADIRTVDPDGLPEHDLICGRFPCQSFSIAGKRGGFEDARGTMFFEIMRIARACRTKYLFLENVKGLLNHKGGATFQTIITTLDELGYDCEWQVLNSKAYVPQNRERVFIIANLRGEPRLQVFPIRETGQEFTERDTETTIARAFTAGGHSGGHHSGMTLIHTAYQDGIREYSDISPTVSTPSGGGHLPMVAQALQTDGQLRSGSSWNTNIPQSQRSIRRLTPIECERLQAFPDNWTKYGLFDGKVKEISDTQRYKMMGNAVTTAVITDIKSRILGG